MNKGPKPVSARELHDWRAFTATLLSKVIATNTGGTDVEAYLDRCAQLIIDPIRTWVQPGGEHDMKAKLIPIMKRAVEVSRLLRCQRACWSIRHLAMPKQNMDSPSRGPDFVLFDESTMEDMDAGETHGKLHGQELHQRQVQIVVCPALYKRGNHNGERYDVEACMERSQVRCSELVA